jgi:hypothetical protein
MLPARDKGENERARMPGLPTTPTDPNVAYILLHNKLEGVPLLRFIWHWFYSCKKLLKAKREPKYSIKTSVNC